MTETAGAMPALVPMIAYEDPAAALEWLGRAFGFEERHRLTEPDGRISHAEMELGGAVIMLATPTPDYESPNHHAHGCEAARRWLSVPYIVDGYHVLVEDVNAHFETAERAGATILSAPADEPYGERTYRVADLEGHRWMFAEVIAADPPA